LGCRGGEGKHETSLSETDHDRRKYDLLLSCLSGLEHRLEIEGILLIFSMKSGASPYPDLIRQEDPMEFTKISGTDLQVSRIALGTWAMGGWMWGGADEEQAIHTIHAALDKGVNLIDTAPVYGFGRSEEVSSPGESHPQALSEPDVNLSAHPAPIIQPQAQSPSANGQRAVGRVSRFFPANTLPCADGD
jgi:hypothetical protein